MGNHQNYNDEIDLREYLEVMVKNWRLIAAVAFALAFLALIFSLIQKPVYEARATILIRSSGASASLGQLAGLAGINFVGVVGVGIGDLTAVLQSQAVAERVLDQMKLAERVEGWNNPELTRQKLISRVMGMLKKPKVDSGLLELKVEFSDQELVADLANGYLEALSYFWNKLNYTEAQKKKEYIESQLPRVEADLRQTEERYKQFTLLGSAGSGGVELSRLSRELDIQNAVYAMLRKEYEAAKLESSKNVQPFSIIDRAVRPEEKSKPKVKLNTMIGLVLGLFSGVFLAFFKEYWEKSGRS